jgi:hypothetical protein
MFWLNGSGMSASKLWIEPKRHVEHNNMSPASRLNHDWLIKSLD